MKPKFAVSRVKNAIVYSTVLLLLCLLLLQSKSVITAVQNALILCYKTVIPSLFPFFIISGIVTGSSLIKAFANRLSPIMKPLFSVGGVGSLPFLIGIVSGYPMGAKATAELYCSKQLSNSEALRLLPFTNNSGPLFIIGAVGTAMLGNASLGLFLYMIHIISAILVGFCFRFYKGNNARNHLSYTMQRSQTPSFSDVMANSIHTMLLVCGFIIFFAAITACIEPVLSLLPDSVSLAFSSMLEVTNGAYAITQTSLPPRIKLSILSAVIGFGGICVMMQVSGIITPAGLSIKTYLIGKVMHSLFAGALCYLTYPFISINVQPVVSDIKTVWHMPELTPAIIPFVILLILIFLITQCRKHGKTAKN